MKVKSWNTSLSVVAAVFLYIYQLLPINIHNYYPNYTLCYIITAFLLLSLKRNYHILFVSFIATLTPSLVIPSFLGFDLRLYEYFSLIYLLKTIFTSNITLRFFIPPVLLYSSVVLIPSLLLYFPQNLTTVFRLILPVITLFLFYSTSFLTSKKYSLDLLLLGSFLAGLYLMLNVTRESGIFVGSFNAVDFYFSLTSNNARLALSTSYPIIPYLFTAALFRSANIKTNRSLILLFIISTAITYILAFYSGSRGAFLAMLAIPFLFLVFNIVNKAVFNGLNFVWLPYVFSAFLTPVVLLIVNNFIPQLLDLSTQGDFYRLGKLRLSIDTINQYYFFGKGLGFSNSVFIDNSLSYANYSTSTETGFLNSFAESGFFGCIFYLGLLITAYFAIVKSFYLSHGNKSYHFGLNYESSNFFSYFIMSLSWLLLASITFISSNITVNTLFWMPCLLTILTCSLLSNHLHEQT